MNCIVGLVKKANKQINGVAMGTKMGPSYAHLFVGYIEPQFFNQYNSPKPDLYRRYIDDCVGTTSRTKRAALCSAAKALRNG